MMRASAPPRTECRRRTIWGRTGRRGAVARPVGSRRHWLAEWSALSVRPENLPPARLLRLTAGKAMTARKGRRGSYGLINKNPEALRLAGSVRPWTARELGGSARRVRPAARPPAALSRPQLRGFGPVAQPRPGRRRLVLRCSSAPSPSSSSPPPCPSSRSRRTTFHCRATAPNRRRPVPRRYRRRACRSRASAPARWRRTRPRRLRHHHHHRRRPRHPHRPPRRPSPPPRQPSSRRPRPQRRRATTRSPVRR